MNAFAVLFILFELINFSFTFVPVWDLEKSSFKLGNEGSITLYTKSSPFPTINLYKQFSISNSKFTETNYISIDNKNAIETKWEDIESTYHLNEKYYICPKGNFFINQYDGDSYLEITPSTFEADNNIQKSENWELICYYIGGKNVIYQGFLNQQKISHMYGLANFPNNLDNWKKTKIQSPFSDFLWTYESSASDKSKYEMISLTFRDSKILLKTVHMTIDDQTNTNYNGGDEVILDYQKDFASTYFNHETDKFYWISSSALNNYSSGYSTESVNAYTTVTNFNSFKINMTSPLQFLKNVKINKLDMIRNTRFAYYEVTSNEDNTKYHGIIDIEKNQVIFNTNETLIEFKPISNTSMLAVTDNSAYQVCLVKEYEKCVTECSSGRIILDSINGNICGNANTCEKGIVLIPEDICILSCNTSIYIVHQNQCGLCKTFFPNEKEFKLFGQNDCLETRPNGTYFINEDSKILDYCNDNNCLYCSNSEICTQCYEGYTPNSEGKCIKNDEKECYSACSECEEKGDEKNHKCTKCSEKTKVLQEGNCINSCSEGYYEESKNCEKCSKNCTSCSKGEEKNGNIINRNCKTCKEGYYLIKEKNYPSNCVSSCPDNLILIDENYCSSRNSTDNDKKEDDKKKGDYMIWIFIILIGIILLIISLCICKKHCARNKSDGEIINDINTELRENNNIVE